MKIVADKDIPGVEEAFSPYGELVLVPGRAISAAHVRDADALLVRTVTGIDEALVSGSSLRFIGSATSGVDHVDTACLEAAGIPFCHAPGCNADAVVNYVLAALACLAGQEGRHWRSRSAGIIGAGNVGGRLASVLIALGMDVAIHDPLLDSSHPLAAHFASLEETLSRAIVSLHVPLTRDGPCPTFHLLDAARLAGLDPQAILINAARGEVIDNTALAAMLETRPQQPVVLDTWENEPAVSPALVHKVAIATPHIAGYSRQGKRNGTAAILRDFCAQFGLQATPAGVVEQLGLLGIPETGSDEDRLDRAILAAYPIAQDRLPVGEDNLAQAFERRRNNYHFRAEFGNFSFPADKLTQRLAADLATLGFRLTGSSRRGSGPA